MNPYFRLDNCERDQLHRQLLALTSPYHNYLDFKSQVAKKIDNVPQRLVKFCERLSERRRINQQMEPVFVQNCPIDSRLPLLDLNDPLNDKYSRKKTYVAEGFLEIFSQLTQTPLLHYEDRDNGDYFIDIHPKIGFEGTQTLKSDGDLVLHTDRAYHNIRSDYISLLGLSSLKENLVYTSFLPGSKLLEHISESHLNILRLPLFITAYDGYSLQSNPATTHSEPHAIIGENNHLCFNDDKTSPLDNAGIEVYRALIAFKNACAKTKKLRYLIDKGDLLTFSNRTGLHSRDVIEIRNPQQIKHRWLLKTYNLDSTKHDSSKEP